MNVSQPNRSNPRRDNLLSMKKLASGLAILLLAGAIHAQETNAFKTQIQSFEAQTYTILIKGIGPIGSISLTGATISVRCKQDIDVTHGTRQYGIVIDFSGEGISHQSAIVDDDELEPLVGGLDYLAKISASASSLPVFEAGITTRSGLRVEANSNRRQSGITYELELDEHFRLPLSTDQVVQMENLVNQAKNYLNELKQAQ